MTQFVITIGSNFKHVITAEGSVSLQTFVAKIVQILQCYEYCIELLNKSVRILIEDYRTHDTAAVTVDLAYIYAWLSDLDEYESPHQSFEE